MSFVFPSFFLYKFLIFARLYFIEAHSLVYFSVLVLVVHFSRRGLILCFGVDSLILEFRDELGELVFIIVGEGGLGVSLE